MREQGFRSDENIPEVLKDKRQLGPEDRFTFRCAPDLPCYNKCCHDVNILLTPVDVLRLARSRQMTTTGFLRAHALVPITKDLHLPVVMLKMEETEDRPCPFLGPDGCTVYEYRPWCCRMYPVGMAIPPARAGVEPDPIFFLFEDDFCEGRGEKLEWTVGAWRSDQGVADREDLERGFKEVVSHPYFIGGRQLDPKRIEMFHMACYDLDSFRRFVFESTFLKRFELEDDLVEKIREDDHELLRFGFRWLRFALFAEPTMKARDKASGASDASDGGKPGADSLRAVRGGAGGMGSSASRPQRTTGKPGADSLRAVRGGAGGMGSEADRPPADTKDRARRNS